MANGHISVDLVIKDTEWNWSRLIISFRSDKQFDKSIAHFEILQQFPNLQGRNKEESSCSSVN